MSTYREVDLTLTPAHRQLKDAVHAFARDVLRPAAAALDRLADPADVIRPGSPLWDALRAAYANGFHTALVPRALGGMGLSGLGLHIALEELGWGSADFAAALACAGFPFVYAAGSGDASLVDEFVQPFVADTSASIVGCWAITEPNHGSDQFMVSTPQFFDGAISGDVVARPDGDAYVVRGSKAPWVSNGTIATHALVYLTIEPGRGMAGNGVALVPLGLPGVSKAPPLDKLGQRALNQGTIVFDDVRIPKHYVLFGPDAYEVVLRQTLALTNAAMGAIFTGVARAAYEEALAHCATRVQGGKRLCEHQLVQKHLFDMFTKVQTARHLSRAAFVYNENRAEPALEHAVAAKVYCTQAAYEVCDTAVQLFGGRGLAKGYLVEKLYRDARASLIEDGSNDVLSLMGAREILASEFVGDPSTPPAHPEWSPLGAPEGALVAAR
jgi:alkylation response protein AidB-like acyl-CoA dehydrogenase